MSDSHNIDRLYIARSLQFVCLTVDDLRKVESQFGQSADQLILQPSETCLGSRIQVAYRITFKVALMDQPNTRFNLEAIVKSVGEESGYGFTLDVECVKLDGIPCIPFSILILDGYIDSILTVKNADGTERKVVSIEK